MPKDILSYLINLAWKKDPGMGHLMRVEFKLIPLVMVHKTNHHAMGGTTTTTRNIFKKREKERGTRKNLVTTKREKEDEES